jgi:hypothetical protein
LFIARKRLENRFGSHTRRLSQQSSQSTTAEFYVFSLSQELPRKISLSLSENFVADRVSNESEVQVR